MSSAVPAGARYTLCVALDRLDEAPGLLERYRFELSSADPIELLLEPADDERRRELERRLVDLQYDVQWAPRVVVGDGRNGTTPPTARAQDLVAAASLLDEARSLSGVLSTGDLSLLAELDGGAALVIGGDRDVSAAFGGVDVEQLDDVGLVYLDPDLEDSAGRLFTLGNGLPLGAFVAIPQTPRGTTLARNALAGGLFEHHTDGDAVTVLRCAGRATARPIPSVAEQAAADDEALERLIRVLAEPSWNCVDVGANNGQFLSLLAAAAPSGEHHAFEPIPHLAAALRGAFPNVTIHELALAAEGGTSSFVHVQSDEAFSGILRRDYHGSERLAFTAVATARLDDVLPESYRPSFVKIDTEGAEGQVLAGAQELLARERPIVVFEHGLPASLSYGVVSCDIWDLLCEAAGLEIYALDGYGPYSRQQFCGPSLHWNYVALRPGLAERWQQSR
jgi:FkbM family methyltransferase